MNTLQLFVLLTTFASCYTSESYPKNFAVNKDWYYGGAQLSEPQYRSIKQKDVPKPFERCLDYLKEELDLQTINPYLNQAVTQIVQILDKIVDGIQELVKTIPIIKPMFNKVLEVGGQIANSDYAGITNSLLEIANSFIMNK